jgi:hypothetical protein
LGFDGYHGLANPCCRWGRSIADGMIEPYA